MPAAIPGALSILQLPSNFETCITAALLLRCSITLQVIPL